jgi:hypothetical protein
MLICCSQFCSFRLEMFSVSIDLWQSEYICMRVVVGSKSGKVTHTAYTAFGVSQSGSSRPIVNDHLVDSSQSSIMSVGYSTL